MMAALGFSGEASAASRLGFVVCGPALTSSQELAGKVDTSGGSSTEPFPGTQTATFCAACTSAIPPVLTLPELPMLSPPLLREQPAVIAAQPATLTPRHGVSRPRSRAPPFPA